MADLPAPLLSPSPLGLPKWTVRDGWIELCSRYAWGWFCTMTFAVSVHPERAGKTWRYWVNQLNRSVFGRHWQGTDHMGVFWVRGSEYQMRGVLHYHALMSAIVDLNGFARRLSWMDEWKKLAGFTKIEPVFDKTAVTKYVTKYVVKGGDIDVSENLHRYYRQDNLL